MEMTVSIYAIFTGKPTLINPKYTKIVRSILVTSGLIKLTI